MADSLDSLIEGQPSFLREYFDVTIVSSPSKSLVNTAKREGVEWRDIKLTRTVSPFRDLVSFWSMLRMLKANPPDIVQSYTPKAGLITMGAARLAGIPIRIHGVVGMPLMESRGLRRKLLKFAERLTYVNATFLTTNSFGLRDFIHENLTTRKIEVIGKGSINGVNVKSYDRELSESDIRSTLGVSVESTVFVYVGRLVRDKGIVELINAFVELDETNSNSHLVLVGEEEEFLSPLPERTRELISLSPKIHKAGWQSDVRPFLRAADIFVLPSYREGLPNSVLEAGAMSLPSIVTDINGCNEIIDHRLNGLIIPVKDRIALRNAMIFLQDNPEEAKNMGLRARIRVLDNFEQETFWIQLAKFYLSLL